MSQRSGMVKGLAARDYSCCREAGVTVKSVRLNTGQGRPNPLACKFRDCVIVKMVRRQNAWLQPPPPLPNFGQQHFFRGFHTPLTEGTIRSGVNGYFYVMVMSDKTAFFQLKSQ